jgi:DNA-binding response OmpR family regulator
MDGVIQLKDPCAEERQDPTGSAVILRDTAFRHAAREVRVAVFGDDHGFAPDLDLYLRPLAIRWEARRLPEIPRASPVPADADLLVLADDTAGPRAIDLLQRLRLATDLPCLVVLPPAQEDVDRIMALEMGADGWIGRGARPREVRAHVTAVLRRHRRARDPAAAAGWRICAERRDLLDPMGRPCGLTPAEFELLRLLAAGAGATVSRDTLSRHIFGRRYTPEDRAIDNLVVRLRRKVEPDPRAPRLIKAARPFGYFFTCFEALAAADAE